MFGFPIWYGNRPLDKIVKSIYESGYEYAEVSLDYPWISNSSEVEEAARLLRGYGLGVAIHAPWRDIGLASPIEGIRVASAEVIKRSVDLASKLNALYVSMHIASHEAVQFSEVMESVKEAAVRTLSELTSYSEDKGVLLLIENDPAKAFGKLEYLEELAKHCQSLKVCLDVGHALMSYAKEGVNVVEEQSRIYSAWVSSLNERIYSVHLHDFVQRNRYVEDHIMIGRGSLRIEEVLGLLKTAKNLRYVLLEVHKREPGAEEGIDPKETIDVLRLIASMLR